MMGLKKQKGMSALGWLVVIAVFGIILTVAAKLLPFYLDNRFVVSALKSLGEDAAFVKMNPSQVRSKLGKTFQINNIRGKAADSVKVSKQKNVLLVTIAYEERVNILFNVDVVVAFNSVLDSRKPEQCCSVVAQ